MIKRTAILILLCLCLTSVLAIKKVKNEKAGALNNLEEAALFEEEKHKIEILEEATKKSNETDTDNNSSSTASSGAANALFTLPVTTTNGIYVKGQSAFNSVNLPGGLTVLQDIDAEYFEAQTLDMDSLAIDKLYNDKQPIQILGGVTLTGIKSTKPLKVNSLIVTGYDQWQLAHHDDYEDKKSLRGWSLVEVSSCEPLSRNKFLGGHCLTSDKEISKTYGDLPAHSLVRIKANYHMIDNWEGETGYMKVDDKNTIWQMKGLAQKSSKIMNQCGNTEHADQLMNRQIDKILEHTGDTIKIAFGSTLQKSPCQASYAVDDVQILVK